jgi:ribosome maturation factor RimP
MTALQTDIEERLADSEPEVEVLLAEVVGGRQLRVFIDHPDGVTLQLCERVSMCLNELRERYSLEVSSPGSERPLTKPAHFARFVGRRARVRTRHPRPAIHSATRPAAIGVSSGRGSAAVAKAAGTAPGAAVGAAAPDSQRTPCAPTSTTSPEPEREPALVSSFTGELVGASEDEVTLAADGGIVAIPYAEIRRSNLVED